MFLRSEGQTTANEHVLNSDFIDPYENLDLEIKKLDISETTVQHSHSESSTNQPEVDEEFNLSYNFLKKNNYSCTSKLSFESLWAYFRELSLNILKEEILGNSKVFTTNDFTYESPHCMSYSFLINQSLVFHLISPNLKKVRKDPFLINQAIFLFNNRSEPWYGYVTNNSIFKSSDEDKNKTSEDRVKVTVCTFNWNKNVLPPSSESDNLNLVFGSIPVSRSLEATKKLQNKHIERLILGNSKISQNFYTTNNKSFNSNLNDSQNLAISNSLKNNISIIQGPPGTGKTSTIVELVKRLEFVTSNNSIMIVASSNAAIDNIAEKLIGTEYEKIAIRMVSAVREIDYDENHVLAPICLHRLVYKELPEVYKEVMSELQKDNSTYIGKALYQSYQRTKNIIIKEVFSDRKIILCTTVTSGSVYLKSLNFSTVIMDEATQSSEPATLIPLALDGVEKIVLVGDQKQLNCFCFNKKLSLSFFERILQNKTITNFDFLDTQFRMHPDISEFPRRKFYDGKLKDGISASERKLPNILS